MSWVRHYCGPIASQTLRLHIQKENESACKVYPMQSIFSVNNNTAELEFTAYTKDKENKTLLVSYRHGTTRYDTVRCGTRETHSPIRFAFFLITKDVI